MPLSDTESRALLELLKENGLPISELQKRSKISGSVISKIVDSLKEKGLVEDKYEMEGRTRKRLIYLTEKGKKVAELLSQIESFLSH
ncbi:MarR family transcriptional regulator [Saccharolobus solfataricus]|jgi:DNA-binding MarR family transcriptional regulator|uniref:MarR family transcriptional regulator n=2 Tax=Saccharolobus solfataricus TaxID=2287 RepID=A0A0E3K5X4_SACSO|nr:helix-turn-helix domain-containing protein [Saccharolobus solfataricus]AKA73839.1 MarR family transcriptional regulator [Saccharolobus solfataricus]AKA76537.1 MarR family transcriptional regulator [Saccharolobus solfataricus]AKA79230.1 MarR family transcriptional regulator [Saccharolobus solfataricus]AZF68319.1 MarR family transcriptional regulator [Saccharolobus solfataricus]AZF70939.1 MarR family transcriptional regulator [Saccharolobus solfataricus]